jgi:hypothetical protein
LSAFIAPCKKKGLEREVEGYRLHLEEMVAERTHQIEAALKLVERSYEDTLEALGAAIDLRDAATEGHSRRVCRFATSDRPYRSALPFEEGFKVIHSESGRLFDPQITGAFFGIRKETWPSIAWNQHEVSSLPSWLRSGGAVAPLPSHVSSRRSQLPSSAASTIAGHSLGLDVSRAARASSTYAVFELEDFDVLGKSECPHPIESAGDSASDGAVNSYRLLSSRAQFAMHFTYCISISAFL